MNTFDNVLRDVFEREAEVRIESAEEERGLIERAKAGDEEATIALVYAYSPALRDNVKRFRFAANPTHVWDGATPGHDGGLEEWRMVAVSGLLEAVQAFDLEGEHRRLAAILPAYLNHEATAAMTSYAAVSVPERSAMRFYGICRRAGGDLAEAERIAPDYAMSRETFRAIRDAVSAGRIEDEAQTEEGVERVHANARPLWSEDDAFASAEDRIAVEAAFRVVDETEDGVIRDAYGFSDYRPLPDGVIAERRGMSRSVVQRKRSSGLGKMRDALAVDVDA